LLAMRSNSYRALSENYQNHGQEQEIAEVSPA
jgi:hypothetical protein